MSGRYNTRTRMAITRTSGMEIDLTRQLQHKIIQGKPRLRFYFYVYYILIIHRFLLKDENIA